MAIDPLLVDALLVAFAGLTAGGAAHVGGKRGGNAALNGTAEGVKRIESTLDTHAKQTREDFKEVRSDVKAVAEQTTLNSVDIAVLKARHE